jgi:hypothetical protein
MKDPYNEKLSIYEFKEWPYVTDRILTKAKQIKQLRQNNKRIN